jgi:ABC-type branched-subunit amino acid transport system substrate-binding protein
VPTLTLDDVAPGAASTAFQLVHAPEARVAALARAALKLGARDFGLIGPDSAAGKRLREAFRREVVAAGGRVTADASYPPGATSFGAVLAAFKKAPPQAVFVADGADRLELVAPALAAADLWPAPWGTPRPAASAGKPRPRTVLLLSTANDLSPAAAERRALRPGRCWPRASTPTRPTRRRGLVDAYRAAYGQSRTRPRRVHGVNRRRATAGARTRADVLRSSRPAP